MTIIHRNEKIIYIGMIGDVIESKKISEGKRQGVQDDLQNVLYKLNNRFNKHITSKFLITLGDEFQGLLHNPEVIPEIVWLIEKNMLSVKVRIGIGKGTLSTAVKSEALGMDGPVWHHARAAIKKSENNRYQGGVFCGFGEREDEVLNGLSLVLEELRSKFTRRQWDILNDLRKGKSQAKIAEEMGVSRQAISKAVKATAWNAYQKGEKALINLLKDYYF